MIRNLGEIMGLLGPALGFFIGVICGMSVVLLIRTATSEPVTLKTTLAEISQLLAIPTFCFGGPWLTHMWFPKTDFEAVLPMYATTLAVSFALIAGYPLIMLIMLTSHGMAETGPKT